jgi:hypothetical protein
MLPSICLILLLGITLLLQMSKFRLRLLEPCSATQSCWLAELGVEPCQASDSRLLWKPFHGSLLHDVTWEMVLSSPVEGWLSFRQCGTIVVTYCHQRLAAAMSVLPSVCSLLSIIPLRKSCVSFPNAWRTFSSILDCSQSLKWKMWTTRFFYDSVFLDLTMLDESNTLQWGFIAGFHVTRLESCL